MTIQYIVFSAPLNTQCYSECELHLGYLWDTIEEADLYATNHLGTDMQHMVVSMPFVNAMKEEATIWFAENDIKDYSDEEFDYKWYEFIHNVVSHMTLAQIGAALA